MKEMPVVVALRGFITAASKVTKDQVNYRHGAKGEQCSKCAYFEVKGPHKCLKVYGVIKPHDLCDLFEVK
jgi:hypothetical protein